MLQFSLRCRSRRLQDCSGPTRGAGPLRRFRRCWRIVWLVVRVAEIPLRPLGRSHVGRVAQRDRPHRSARHPRGACPAAAFRAHPGPKEPDQHHLDRLERVARPARITIFIQGVKTEGSCLVEATTGRTSDLEEVGVGSSGSSPVDGACRRRQRSLPVVKGSGFFRAHFSPVVGDLNYTKLVGFTLERDRTREV
jgi:hypothetical protein